MKSLLRALIGFAACIAGCGCALAADHLSVGTTGKGAAPNWPIVIARDEGFFAEEKLSVDLTAAPSAANVIEQLVAGSIDIGTGGISDPMRAIDQGAPISMLRVGARVPPYTLWSKPSIHSIKELQHKLIMLGGPKDVTRIYLERMLVPNELRTGDYDMVFAGTTVARYSALLGGAIDATLLAPPFNFTAPSTGFVKIGDLNDYVKNLPFTGYAVRTEWAKTHKSVLSAFLDGVAKGVDWFYDPANREAAIQVLLKESGSTRDVVAKTYDYYRAIKIFDHRGAVTPNEVADLTTAMKSIGDLDGATDFKRFVNPDVAAVVMQTR